MKDVISYLIQHSNNVSEILKIKLFNLTVADSASSGIRKKREGWCLAPDLCHC